MTTIPMTFITLMAGGAAEGGAAQGGGIMSFLPIIAIFMVLYFLMIRPQAKRQKEQRQMLAEIQQGEEIVTIGGIHGTVSGIREADNSLIVKIADNTKIIIDRSAVGRKLEKK